MPFFALYVQDLELLFVAAPGDDVVHAGCGAQDQPDGPVVQRPQVHGGQVLVRGLDRVPEDLAQPGAVRAENRFAVALGQSALHVLQLLADESPRVVIVADRRPAMALCPPGLPWLDKAATLHSASRLIATSTARSRGALGSLDFTYDGTPHAATATTTPAGLNVIFTYDGAATAPTNAGTYAVVATVADANYFGGAAGTLTIAKAPATIALGDLLQVYTGAGHVASATTAPAGLGVAFTYDGNAAAPVNAGTYAVAATVTNANYYGSANGTLVIAKAPAPVALGSLTATYDGTPKSATATTTPAALAVSFTYDGAATAPTNAGSYAVAATVNDANYFGGATGTLTIAKAPALIALGSLNAIYDGTPKSASATTTPVALAVLLAACAKAQAGAPLTGWARAAARR